MEIALIHILSFTLLLGSFLGKFISLLLISLLYSPFIKDFQNSEYFDAFIFNMSKNFLNLSVKLS